MHQTLPPDERRVAAESIASQFRALVNRVHTAQLANEGDVPSSRQSASLAIDNLSIGLELENGDSWTQILEGTEFEMDADLVLLALVGGPYPRGVLFSATRGGGAWGWQRWPKRRCPCLDAQVRTTLRASVARKVVQ